MNIFILVLFLFTSAHSWKLLVPNAHDNRVVFGTKNRNVLRCAVSGLAPGSSAEVNWEFDKKYNKKVNKHPSSDGAQFVTFSKKVTTADSGRFICVAKYGNETKEYEVFVNFIDEPRFDKVETLQHPIVNQGAKIRCPVTNLGEHSTVYWTKDEDIIMSNNQTTFEDGGKILVFKNYSIEQDGTYTCNVPFLERVQTKNIEVSGFMAPRITNYNLPSITLEGKDAVFSCRADGVPTPEVDWLKITNANSTEKISASPKYEIAQNGVLVIKNASVLDVGVYICSASNELNITDNRNVTLNVITRPQIASFGNILVKKGGNVSIPCRTSGNDEIVDWFTYAGLKVNALTQGASYGYRVEGNTVVLVVMNVTEHSENKFKCVAHNKAGETSAVALIKVIVEPKIQRNGKEVKRAVISDIPTTVTITCNVTGIPTPDVKWYKDGYELEVDGTTYALDEDTIEGSSVLNVHPNSASHFGTYHCEAENMVGKDKGDEVRLLQVLEPAQPKYKCDYLLPTRAKCELQLDSIEEGRIPTSYSARFYSNSSKFEEHDIRPSGNTIEIEKLTPSSVYHANFMAHNELSSTGWSTTPYKIQTSAPRVPESVRNITVMCVESCKIEWIPGRNNGKPITSYNIKLYRDGGNVVWVGGSNETTSEVFSLAANSRYEVRVEAVNQIGSSPVAVYEFETPEFPRSSGLYTMIGIVALIFLILVAVALDFAFYRLKGRSVLQALYRCGKTPEVDAKINKAENESLLVESGKAQTLKAAELFSLSRCRFQKIFMNKAEGAQMLKEVSSSSPAKKVAGLLKKQKCKCHCKTKAPSNNHKKFDNEELHEVKESNAELGVGAIKKTSQDKIFLLENVD